ncbi:MAG: PDDEXK nuclease domain-containing protein [Gemmataceae bacterium]
MARKQTPPAKPARSTPSSPAGGVLPAGYAQALDQLKARVRAAQLQASLSVNRELICLYWDIGKQVVERQKAEKWGSAVIDRLGRDLQQAFPGVVGFSRQNLWYMRSFYLAWTEEVMKLQQPVGELDGASLPAAVAAIPWGHNIQLLSKLQDPAQRLWYALKTTEHGWSRAVLLHQIETGAHERQGQAITNFDRTLPPAQSDLAREVLKDPYHFDFLALGPAVKEEDIRRGLLQHLRDFLVELGTGFAYVGTRHHLEVGGQDFYLDLLFYHLRLRSFIVVELKLDEFEPEHAGKMNFYLSAVDDLVRHPEDRPSIGLILCRRKNRVVVEYSLRDTTKPMGVASYQLRRDALPAPLRDNLPSVEQIETELGRMPDATP